MRILGIETSCDETAVSLIEAHGSFENGVAFRILGNALLSQAKEHEKYGGVFPNVAKREHQRALVPVLQEALREAGLLDTPRSVSEETLTEIEQLLEREPELFMNLGTFLRSTGAPPLDAIAVTVGPGLEPALWVGVNFAKALGIAWRVPLVAVNHMEGHIMLSASDGDRLARFELPLMSLLISGGHTELVLSREWMQYEIIGATRDDAVGEAFDKVARLMDLPYPGGPHVSRLASQARTQSGDALPSISLPRPMIETKDYDFSFAGLKTAVRRFVEASQPLSDDMKMALAREFEDACADVLVAKTMRAIEEHGVKTLVVGGGVSANSHIRTCLKDAITDYGCAKLLIPPPELATDNALMIAFAGFFRAQKQEFAAAETLRANGNMKLS